MTISRQLGGKLAFGDNDRLPGCQRWRCGADGVGESRQCAQIILGGFVWQNNQDGHGAGQVGVKWAGVCLSKAGQIIDGIGWRQLKVQGALGAEIQPARRVIPIAAVVFLICGQKQGGCKG